MAEAYGPTSCSSGYVLKSKLLHYPESQYGFILKLCHQSAKTIALTRLKTKVRLSRDYEITQRIAKPHFAPLGRRTDPVCKTVGLQPQNLNKI